MDKKVILDKVDLIGVKYNNKVISITVLFILIVAFVFMYLFTLVLSEWVLKIVKYTGSTLNFMMLTVIGASALSFVVTYIIHFAIVKIFKADYFISWFKNVHMGLIYISGLYSALYAVQPYLIGKSIIAAEEIGGENTYWFIVFFIAITNYAMYDHIIISKGAAPKLKSLGKLVG